MIDCPCAINEQVFKNYIKWVKATAIYYSENWIDSIVTGMRNKVRELNMPADSLAGGDLEGFAIDGLFYAISSQDPPSLSNSDIATPKAKWKIDFPSVNYANVSVSFKGGWETYKRGKEVTEYYPVTLRFPMVKEKDVWKLAGLMEHLGTGGEPY